MARKPSSFIEFPLIRRQDKDSFFESPFAKFWAPTWHIRLLFKFSSTKVLFATRTLPFLCLKKWYFSKISLVYLSKTPSMQKRPRLRNLDIDDSQLMDQWWLSFEEKFTELTISVTKFYLTQFLEIRLFSKNFNKNAKKCFQKIFIIKIFKTFLNQQSESFRSHSSWGRFLSNSHFPEKW